jgi:hypothetical protein
MLFVVLVRMFVVMMFMLLFGWAFRHRKVRAQLARLDI